MAIGSGVIYTQETGWQSGPGYFIMAGLPTHLLQELNVGTEVLGGSCCSIVINNKALKHAVESTGLHCILSKA